MTKKKDKPNMQVDLGRGLILQNPVMTASGTLGRDGYGAGLPETDLGRLGAIVLKTVTEEPDDGNELPVWWPASRRETRSQDTPIYLNAVGLGNTGLESILPRIPMWAERFGTKIIVSIAATTADGLGRMAERISSTPGAAALELNLSCPNTHEDALWACDPALTDQAVSAVREHTDLSVWAKLAPNVPDITTIAVAAEWAGADALTISNTLPAMAFDVERGTPALGNVMGGLSGPALKPVVLALVYQAAQAVSIPVIGVGGVANGRDALEYLMAGAAAVQVGTANLLNPRVALKVLEQLERHMRNRRIGSLSEIAGTGASIR